MRIAEINSGRRFVLRIALLAGVALLLAGLSAAPASAAPKWRIGSLAPSSVAAGEKFTFRVEMEDVGDSHPDATVEPWTFNADFPPGIVPISAFSVFNFGWDCSSFATTATCEDTSDSAPLEFWPHVYFSNLIVEVEVEPGAAGQLTSHFEIAGGGAPAAATADPTLIAPEPPAFGIDAFDQRSFANAAGDLSSQAGGRPYEVNTEFDFNSVLDPVPSPSKGIPRPVEPVKNIVVDLPPGLIGDTANVTRCSMTELVNGDSGVQSLCPPSSQVGTTTIRTDLSSFGFPLTGTFGPHSVYNMVPPPYAPARFGFVVFGTVITIDADVRSDGDYGIRAVSSDTPAGLTLLGSSTSFWGVPSDPVHTRWRHCPGGYSIFPEGGESCSSEAPQVSFWRNPTSCEDEATGSVSRLSVDSWFDPGAFDEASSASHVAPGYPYPSSEQGAPQGPTGCSKVVFKPQFETDATTTAADSPSGLDLHIRVPQTCWSQKDTLCQSDLRDAAVKLPAGMTLNPSSASGLAACSSQQVGLLTQVGASPIHFDKSPVTCPENSKLGSVEIFTPLLDEPLEGAVFLAKQGDNPFGSLLAMYLVAEGSGVVVKQAGEIEVGPGGRLTTVVRDAPQLPFSDFHVQLFGGSRAPLRTPAACGTYTTEATLTPWSGNPASVLGSDFAITGCGTGAFDPKLSAGTQNPLAGVYSPFSLRVTREDGTQEIAGLSAALPKGLIGKPAGIPYCPDSVLASVSEEVGTGAAQEQSPSCPAASQVGTVTVGAGAGPNPFYTTAGRAYWAGPYKGAPLSLAVVAPAVAGPFDLGSVVVRNALQIDPETAEVTAVSDPIPAILHDIPLDLRDIRVELNRPDYILNPTSCDEMQIGSTVTSTEGGTTNPSQRFQVAGCDRLGFKPKLSMRLIGPTNRGAHPKLRAVLRMPKGGANIARAQVTLPRAQLLENSHIRTICTRVQYAARTCPKDSVYGYARAFSPLLDQPLQGPVYLRSSNHQLPDLVASLDGQIHIDLVGRIDSVRGHLRTTFASVPDAPVNKFLLTMQGGGKGLLVNERNLCRGKNRAIAQFDAQSGKVRDILPVVKADCGKGSARGKGAKRKAKR